MIVKTAVVGIDCAPSVDGTTHTHGFRGFDHLSRSKKRRLSLALAHTSPAPKCQTARKVGVENNRDVVSTAVQ